MLLLSHDKTIIAGITSVIVHEAAHLTVIALCGCTVEGIEVTPVGLIIQRIGLTGHLQDIAIHLAGPLANLGMAGILYALSMDAQALPVTANLFFGLLNLLPIETLDGGKAFEAMLATRLSELRCLRVCRLLSNTCLLLLWMLSAASLLMLDGSPSLLIFCVALFVASMNK